MMQRLLLIGIFLLGATGISAEEEFVYDPHGKRDPFLRLVSVSGAILSYDDDVSVSDMILEGIIVGDDGESVAIINGTIVKPADQLGLFSVIQIEPNTVILQKGDEQFSLKLKKED